MELLIHNADIHIEGMAKPGTAAVAAARVLRMWVSGKKRAVAIFGRACWPVLSCWTENR